MEIKDNIHYWRFSLENPEPLIDEYYYFDEIIVNDYQFIDKVEKLRELIITYCSMINIDIDASLKVLERIHEIINSTEKIQYTEFIAFWKVFDLSYSKYKEAPKIKQFEVLANLLKKYCESRITLYRKLGFTNTTVQALYDAGASRKKSISGIRKILDIVSGIFGYDIPYADTIEKVKNYKMTYFLPDQKDKNMFYNFCRFYNIEYKFGNEHQGKLPDIVLKIGDHLFIIEAKHLKEPGGAQDKQISELIDFIKYSEKQEHVHYVAFLDGPYFNYFINNRINIRGSKIKKQRDAIEQNLKRNPRNFFVNTAGLKILLKDLKNSSIITSRL
jgi:hypothetical protein